MINIPTFLVQQAQRRLASIRANAADYRNDAADARMRAAEAEQYVAECERDEAELTAFLAQIGVPVPQGDPAANPAVQEG